MFFAKFKLYLIIAGVTLALGLITNGLSLWKGISIGEANINAKWNEAKLASTEKKIDTKAKQDEIKNAPIDTAVTIRRLRNGTF